MVLADDVRYAVRSLVRRPAFAALTMLIVALGVGATTTVFSLVDQTVLRPPPFLHGDRLVDVMDIRRGGSGGNSHPAEKVVGWREQTSVFERLETYAPREFDLSGGDTEPERIQAPAVSVGLYDMLGVRPFLGRPFTRADGVPGAARVVIVGAGLAERRLGGVRSALGASIRLSSELYTVVGVMADTFTLLGREQAWVPIDERYHVGRPEARDFFVVARLVPGMSVAAAQSRANEIADRLQAEQPLRRSWDIRIDEKRAAWTTAATRSALLALLGGVGCLLLLTCVSVAQLVLSRGMEQQTELAIRASLGASRASLVRQMLVEASLLAAAGAALGVGGATWAVRALAGTVVAELVSLRTSTLTVDARALSVSIAATLATVVASGLLPALRLSRPPPYETLVPKGATTTPRGVERVSLTLVTAQVACAIVLVVGAALMFRTIANVTRIPLGFEPGGLVSMNIDLPTARYPTPASQHEFFEGVLARLRRAPGVRSASVAGHLRVHEFGYWDLEAPGRPAGSDPLLTARNMVDDAYFDTLGIPLVSGRPLTIADSGTGVAVLGRSLASRLWPAGGAVGAWLRDRDDPANAWQIVGVVDDIDARVTSDRRMDLQWYTTWPTDAKTSQMLAPTGSVYRRLIVRAPDTTAAVAAAKAAVWAVDPNQPIERITLATDEVRAEFTRHRLVQRLMTVFSAAGLLVAAVGVFGVLSHIVVRRRREIGVRMALGATPARIGRLVAGRAGLTIAAGVAVGVAGAAALSRTLQSVLFDVSPWDPLSFIAAAALVGLTGLLAAWWPARLAARVEPAVAMRVE